MTASFRHYDERLRRRLSWYSDSNPFFELMRGLMLNSWDSYRAACFMSSEDRPRPYPAQAMAVSRIAIEALGHILYLTERPQRVYIFWRDSYREKRRAVDRIGSLFFAGEPAWAAWLNEERLQIARLAAQLRQRFVPPSLRLTKDEEADVVNRIRPWPSAERLRPDSKGVMHHDQLGFDYLTGSRLAAWCAAHDIWYAEQSRFAHSNDVGVHAAFRVRSASDEELAILRTDPLIPGVLAVMCILSEIEDSGGWPTPKPTALNDAWTAVCELSTPARHVYDLRYAALLA